MAQIKYAEKETRELVEKWLGKPTEAVLASYSARASLKSVQHGKSP